MREQEPVQGHRSPRQGGHHDFLMKEVDSLVNVLRSWNFLSPKWNNPAITSCSKITVPGELCKHSPKYPTFLIFFSFKINFSDFFRTTRSSRPTSFTCTRVTLSKNVLEGTKFVPSKIVWHLNSTQGGFLDIFPPKAKRTASRPVSHYKNLLLYMLPR